MFTPPNFSTSQPWYDRGTCAVHTSLSSASAPVSRPIRHCTARKGASQGVAQPPHVRARANVPREERERRRGAIAASL